MRPRVFKDSRGYFLESYNAGQFAEKVAPVAFVQDNESESVSGVVRGLHFQHPPFAQAKLVRCVRGCILDVAVDLRKDSPTYGRHVAIELSAESHEQIFIPAGFAHGFAVLSPEALFQYKCSAPYTPRAEGSLAAFDPDLNIAWPFGPDEATLSDKDKIAPAFKDFVTPF